METVIDDLTAQLQALKGVHSQNEELKVSLIMWNCYTSCLQGPQAATVSSFEQHTRALLAP